MGLGGPCARQLVPPLVRRETPDSYQYRGSAYRQPDSMLTVMHWKHRLEMIAIPECALE